MRALKTGIMQTDVLPFGCFKLIMQLQLRDSETREKL